MQLTANRCDMKLITIGLLFITLTANGQLKKQNNSETYIAMGVLVGTFATVQSMDTPMEYYGNNHLLRMRHRQRATVALTGMITTTVTYYVVKHIRHKVKRNKAYKNGNNNTIRSIARNPS